MGKAMQFKVVLYETEEGFGVFCPSLHGCVSQEDTGEVWAEFRRG